MQNYKKIIFLILLSFILADALYAQPELDLSTNRLRYRDVFDRIENVYFTNKGDQPLIIDSIYYNSNLYYIRFDKYYTFPFVLQPGDSALMDCIISGYPWITISDTTDTMYIINNGKNQLEKIKIEIQFYHDKTEEGTITGKVTDGANPISNAQVYFFLEGNYIIRKIVTDANGNYSMELPVGYYSIGAAADSFYVSFYDGRRDPFRAKIVKLGVGSQLNINFQLEKIDYNGNSVRGRILDSLSHNLLKRAIIVMRKGDHTPKKIVNKSSHEFLEDKNIQDTSLTYTALLNSNGTYSIEGIKEPGYYYIQSFSDYYVPTYYSNDNASVFWQQADSIYINTNLTNIDIRMPRDSSIGGGSVSGKVLTSQATQEAVSDVVIYAQSTSNNLLYNYGLSKEDGSYRVADLPYGNYNLIAQKIGLPDASANNININPSSYDTTGVNILFIIASANENPDLPNSIELYQNYPNPFNPTTTIKYVIPIMETGIAPHVQLKIYDLLGREAATLVNQTQTSGSYKVVFDAANLASGVYIYQLKVDSPLTGSNQSIIYSQKLVLIK